jgi:hypothetical protein
MLSLFLSKASNLNWIRQPAITECQSLRLRISLPRKIPLANVRGRYAQNRGTLKIFPGIKKRVIGDTRITTNPVILKLLRSP